MRFWSFFGEGLGDGFGDGDGFGLGDGFGDGFGDGLGVGRDCGLNESSSRFHTKHPGSRDARLSWGKGQCTPVVENLTFILLN